MQWAKRGRQQHFAFALSEVEGANRAWQGPVPDFAYESVLIGLKRTCFPFVSSEVETR